MIGKLLASVQDGSLIAWPDHLDLPHVGARLDLGILGEVIVTHREFTTQDGLNAREAVRVRAMPQMTEEQLNIAHDLWARGIAILTLCSENSSQQ